MTRLKRGPFFTAVVLMLAALLLPVSPAASQEPVVLTVTGAVEMPNRPPLQCL